MLKTPYEGVVKWIKAIEMFNEPPFLLFYKKTLTLNLILIVDLGWPWLDDEIFIKARDKIIKWQIITFVDNDNMRKMRLVFSTNFLTQIEWYLI